MQWQAPTFDPVKLLQEFAVVTVVAGALLLAWLSRRSLLLAISGDARIHLTCLDCIWFAFCRCCGCCSGDWTRCLSKCPCCPKRYRGTNLVKSSGQFLGLTSYSVELKNIVVGDLPSSSRGNFYLAVECAANPELVTSLAEEKLPKIVHFPEVITLRLRWSHLEHQVRITVKDLRIVGSTELCHCYFDPNDVLHWSKYRSEQLMRFEMRAIDPSYLAETPPWIALQFSHPTESRDLDHFHGDIDTVRTTNADGHCDDFTVGKFKETYQLLDQTGSAIQEPDEGDLLAVHRLQSVCTMAYWCCNCWTFILIIVYLTFRVYVWSCYRQFRIQTTAHLQNETFPISIARLVDIHKECSEKVRGTGADDGTTPCRPSVEQVQHYCKADFPMLQETTGQPSPRALSMLVYKLTGVLSKGVSCNNNICTLRDKVAEWDCLLYGCCIFLVLFVCFCRMCSHSAVRQMKHGQKSRQAEHVKTMNNVLRDPRHRQRVMSSISRMSE